jgi:hypothetical protein
MLRNILYVEKIGLPGYFESAKLVELLPNGRAGAFLPVPSRLDT